MNVSNRIDSALQLPEQTSSLGRPIYIEPHLRYAPHHLAQETDGEPDLLRIVTRKHDRLMEEERKRDRAVQKQLADHERDVQRSMCKSRTRTARNR